jgi:hypothetical protein
MKTSKAALVARLAAWASEQSTHMSMKPYFIAGGLILKKGV